MFCQKCKAKYPEIIKALDMESSWLLASFSPHSLKETQGSWQTNRRNPLYVQGSVGEARVPKDTEKIRGWAQGFQFLLYRCRWPGEVQKPDGCDNLYNLDRMAAADPSTVLYIVEGEKCADAMTAKGFLATSTNTGSQRT